MTDQTKNEARSMMTSVQNANNNYILDMVAADRLLTLCDLAGLIADEFGSEKEDIVVSVGEQGQMSSVTVFAEELLFDKKESSDFFRMIQAADSFRFEKAADDLLRIRFEVKGLWVQV